MNNNMNNMNMNNIKIWNLNIVRDKVTATNRKQTLEMDMDIRKKLKCVLW
jgi:hypothetical protein